MPVTSSAREPHFHRGVKRIPNREAELFRLFSIVSIVTGSDPRRAMSSAYSMSVSGGPRSTSNPQALQAGSVKRIPNREAELFRLFSIVSIVTGSDPRRAMSSAYSMSVSGGPRSTSNPQALQAGSESSMIVSMTKLKRKGERGQPCRTPLDVVNSGESFP
ncbi:hypothetical protein T265_07631 [Opisthorchis viverrini]|uniref:Uncharacterized protein n=1 Tax=Opisthorchis viverrini TaxID=6198 RepID=A0A074ZBS4_OPIVI|nr:hypothetical protein T265_07631 [Opisthorchis viverrini]KER24741.1 hypothetical protein T265_07631 [Opisthorchis viverrini]